MDRHWDTALCSSMLMMYAETIALLQRQKIAPIEGWEAEVSMMQKWAVLLSLMLVPEMEHL